MNITLKITDKIALIVARDKPNIFIATSLQLIEFFFNSSKSCSFDNVSDRSFVLQTKDSLKKPRSIPKW